MLLPRIGRRDLPREWDLLCKRDVLQSFSNCHFDLDEMKDRRRLRSMRVFPGAFGNILHVLAGDRNDDYDHRM